jgi:DNA-binding beta-propeller fold protein YncE
MHMTIRHRASVLVLALATLGFGAGTVTAAASESVAQPLARTTHVSVLPGSGHSWGFAAKDPTRPYLFIARRENGLTVFNTDTQQAVRTLDDSAGANGVVFVPDADRAYITNMDGSLTVVRLSDLKTLKRLPVTDANLNSAVYEPISRRVIVASGRRANQSTLYILDPKQDRVVGERNVDIKKIDPLLVLGDGNLLLPMRDEGKVIRLNGKTLETLASYSFPGCVQPSALASDNANRRLFVACRGKAPILTIADLDSGAPIASLPITPAVNALAWDSAQRRLLIPSGNAGNLSVVQQDDADHYRMLGYVGTRLWAHNMVYDQARSTAYLFTMDFTQPAADAAGHKQDPVFHADSFTVLTLTLNPPSP